MRQTHTLYYVYLAAAFGAAPARRLRTDELAEIILFPKRARCGWLITPYGGQYRAFTMGLSGVEYAETRVAPLWAVRGILNQRSVRRGLPIWELS